MNDLFEGLEDFKKGNTIGMDTNNVSAPIEEDDDLFSGLDEFNNTIQQEKENNVSNITSESNKYSIIDKEYGINKKIIEEAKVNYPELESVYDNALIKLEEKRVSKYENVKKEEADKLKRDMLIEQSKKNTPLARTEALGRGALRPVLGLARTVTNMGLDEKYQKEIMDYIDNNEAQINQLIKDNELREDDMLRPDKVGQLLMEILPVSKATRLFTIAAGTGATVGLSEYGVGKEAGESTLTGIQTAGTVYAGGKALDALGYIAGRVTKGLKDKPEEVLDYIRKNDDKYNNDEAINEALDNYYKIFEPSNDVTADKVRAVLHSSKLLGSEMKAGAIQFDNTVMSPLRQTTSDISAMLQKTAKESGSPIDDLAVNIDKAVNSPQYRNGMDIIKSNFNDEVSIDKIKFLEFKKDLDGVAILEPDNAIVKSLSSKISNKLKRAEKLGIEPKFTVEELIDFEKSIGEARFKSSIMGGTKSFKAGEADRYITGLVEDALSRQPEGLELYKQMKQVYSETSPFFKKAKADAENKMSSIVKDISDKKITEEVGLDELISLRDKGLTKFEEISKIVPAESLERFENKLAESMLSKTKDYSKLVEMFKTADFKTANAKAIKEQVNALDDLFKSEQVESRLRGLFNNQADNRAVLTADLMQKAKYTVAGNIWNRIMTIVSPKLRKARNVADILQYTGEILKDIQKIKGISKVSDEALKEAVNKTTKTRESVVSKAQQATQYESARQSAREANKQRLKQIGAQRRVERKTNIELEKQKKAGRLGF